MSQASPTDESVLGEGHVVLVTGSTSGIGREVARNVAETGATVLVHGRDEDRALETVAALPGEGHDRYLAEFADLEAVRELAAAVRADHDRLDCLVNNAGTWQGERLLVDVPGSPNDVELTFVVNHLAPFVLTHELADRLVETADRRVAEGPGSARTDGADEVDADGAVNGADHSADRRADDGADRRADDGADRRADDGADSRDDDSDDPDRELDPARVVTVSSGVHHRVTMDLEAVTGHTGPSGVAAYGLSKLANVMFTYELARRLPDGVTANCCHPGAAPATRLARAGSLFSWFGWRLFGLVGTVIDVTKTPDEAARTPTYLARSPEVAGVAGEYFQDCEATRSSDASYDREAQAELWRRSEAWVDLPEELSMDA